MLSFKPAFSLSSFTFIKRFFSSSLLSAIWVVYSAYLKLLLFSWWSWFHLVIHQAQHFTWCILHISFFFLLCYFQRIARRDQKVFLIDQCKEIEESNRMGKTRDIFMASHHSPIISWQTDGETVETVTDFIFLSSKITADGDCSHEIKRHLLLGRKVMTNLDSILKSRDITLPTKVHLVKAWFFK